MSEVGNLAESGELADENRLIAVLSEEFGGEANNGTLRDALGWPRTKYWSVRNRLLDHGLVQKAHGGPGGKTMLIAPSEREPPIPVSEEETAELTLQIGVESDLYPAVLAQISTNWSSDEGYDSCIARITAALGKRDTGGKWTRPDISAVAVQKFKFLRDPVFDVVTFEVKPRWNMSVEGVFEALAHRQYANRAYAIYQSNVGDFENLREYARILALAEQHGVGIFIAPDPSDYETWIERVRPRRWNPDPFDLNDFIQRIFHERDHDAIIKLNK